MSSERIDETFLIRYLLGNLTEEQEVEVEDRAFADGDYLGAIEAVEADLIDSYVRGGLSEVERRAFERRFLTSPGRRGKVEFARALAKVASESQPAKRATGWRTMLNLRLATALATLVLVAGAMYLIVQNTAMRSRIAKLEDRAIQPPQQQSPTPAVASLVFMPGLTRGGQRTKQLPLNPDAQIVHIEIQLDDRDDYPHFRVELRTRSGEEILTRGNLFRSRTGSSYIVSFDVPASALPDGQYELTLRGVPNEQSVQDLGYYYFTVQRR